MAKLSQKGLLAIALVLSIGTAALIYNYLQQAVEKPTTVEGELVVIARADIAPKTRITPDMIQEVRVPREYIQPGAMRELPRVVGVMTREQIVGGEQVLDRRLLLEGKQAGFSGVIPAGKRAITVSANEVTAVAGLLKTGDYVDVFVTFDKQDVGTHMSRLLLQNVLVLSVNRDNAAAQTDKEAPGKKEAAKEPVIQKMATVTLAVSPEDAVKVALSEEKGKVRFALRPYIPEDGKTVDKTVKPQDVLDVQISAGRSGPTDPPSGGGTSSPGGGAATTDKKKDNPFGVAVIRGTKVE